MYRAGSERASVAAVGPRARAIPPVSLLDGQRGHLLPWAPVCLGAGIATYFSLRFEPSQAHWLVLAALGALVALGIARLGLRAPLLIGLGLALAGFALAGARTHLVSAPVLGFRYYGPIQGRVIEIDRSASDKVRLTLDHVLLERVDPDRTPERVRVSLHGDQDFVIPEPGLTVMLTGHLGGPEGPVEPGGYDFQRQAWFDRLGAVGYTRSPALAWAPAEEGRAGLMVHRARNAISTYVQAHLPGRIGAFATALTTGDRSAMDEPTLEALRISNLAHLLAISGLHMGMLTGFVFAAMRYGLALWPRVALRWPVHRIAAAVALGSGAVYLALSGGNVATQRAFIMVAVMLTAILLDRRALTLRSVALAAIIVLILSPEALMGPGFQMSFAATSALIAVFAALRGARLRRLHPALGWIAALVISSAVAGFATGPYAAAHFNRVPHYGLVANLLSVPVMGTLVMPAAVVAALLSPFGLGWIGLAAMQPGLAWILWVADRVSGWEGASSAVVSPPWAVLPILTLGGLWLILWQGRARLAGVVPILVALALWTQADRPALLIAEDGGLVGVMTPAGRALSKPKGAGFAAESWLENDGDSADQATAASRDGFEGKAGDLRFDLAGHSGRALSGRGAAGRVAEACGSAELVILSGEAEDAPAGDCVLFDRTRLRQTGPVAVFDRDGRLTFVATSDDVGPRPWTDAGRLASRRARQQEKFPDLATARAPAESGG